MFINHMASKAIAFCKSCCSRCLEDAEELKDALQISNSDIVALADCAVTGRWEQAVQLLTQHWAVYERYTSADQQRLDQVVASLLPPKAS